MKRLAALIACGTAFLPGTAFAHAFGGRYDLPLPLQYFQLAAGVAVLLSFIGLAVFARPGTSSGTRETGCRLGQLHRLPRFMQQLAAVVYLFLVIAALFGSRNVMDNIAPTFVWVWMWVGVAFLAAAFGDVWKLISPFPAFGRWIRARRRYALPNAVGRWPAFASFLVFAWLELVSGFGEQPFMLGIMMSVYLVWLAGGMWLFGAGRWLDAADVFENVFGLFGRFGILRILPDRDVHEIRLQWPGAGLLAAEPIRTSQTAIVIALLAAVSFDGLLETPGWLAVQIWIENSAGWRPLLLAVHAAGINLLAFVKTLALLAAPLVFTMAYLTCVGIMRVIGGDEGGLARLFNGFALSLVPIAAAYHLAHYLSYLSIAGQHLVPLLSDPFGFGWNLFDTRDYTIRIGLVSPKAVWIFSAIAIVTGHLVSIALAHWQASSVYRDSRRVIASQLPMVVLMIGYTMVSLWILSQPIIETG